ALLKTCTYARPPSRPPIRRSATPTQTYHEAQHPKNPPNAKMRITGSRTPELLRSRPRCGAYRDQLNRECVAKHHVSDLDGRQCARVIAFGYIHQGLRDLHRSFRERVLCPLKHFFGPLDVFYSGIAWDHRSRPNRNIATDLDFRPQRVVTDLRNRCLGLLLADDISHHIDDRDLIGQGQVD